MSSQARQNPGVDAVPQAPRAHGAHGARLPIARVQLAENIPRPGKDLGVSSGLDHVFFHVSVLEHPVLARQAQGRAYVLELDRELGCVVLRHPEADHEQLVPLTQVRHITLLGRG